MNTMPPFSQLKHIRHAVCSPKGSTYYATMCMVYNSSLVFGLLDSVLSKAMTNVLLRPTLFLTAMNHFSLQELHPPNHLRLILPYIVLAGALFG